MSQKKNKRAILPVRLSARIGYAARGTIYLIIGSLGLLQAIGAGGDSTDSKGALRKVLDLPFGVAIVWILFAGLVCYALWRFTQCFVNTDDHDSDLKGYTIRFGLFCSGISHAGLAYYALTLTGLKMGGNSGGKSTSDIVAMLLNLPLGFILVFGLGLAIGGMGIAHFAKAYRKRYEKRLELEQESLKTIHPICQTALAARGITFLLIAALFISAGVQKDPSDAGGLKDALDWIQSFPMGNVLLAVLAAGLLLFSTYCYIESFARSIDSLQDS